MTLFTVSLMKQLIFFQFRDIGNKYSFENVYLIDITCNDR